MKKTKKYAILLSLLSAIAAGSSIAYLLSAKSVENEPVKDFETLRKTLQDSNEFLAQNNQNNDFETLNDKYQTINNEYSGYKSQDIIDTRNNELQDELQKAKDKLLVM
ncbi:hypothetical protein ACWXVT_02265 [Mycoplasma sp. 1573]